MARATFLAVAAVCTAAAGMGCAQILGIGDPHTCGGGTTYCDGVCVDLRKDELNCGACGRSCHGASCVNGLCVDPDCEHEFSACSAPMSGAPECGGLDCVEFAAFQQPVCLRTCEDSEECQPNSFCAPGGELAYREGFGQFLAAAFHCVPSFCGGPAGSWYANGQVNGECWVGNEGYLREGAVLPQRGTCVLLFRGGAGVCLQAGQVQAGGSCSFVTSGCIESETYESCVQGFVCLGSAEGGEGTCAQVCDPKTSGQCPPGTACQNLTGEERTLGVCQ